MKQVSIILLLLLGFGQCLANQANDKNQKSNLARFDLTSQEARVSCLNRWDPKQSIIYRPKEVKAVVNIFTDVDCGYCRKLHEEIPALMNLGIELRYLAYPRQGQPSLTYTKMASIWCSKEPSSTMTKAMKGEDIPSIGCKNTISAQRILAEKLGISGTPMLVFEDGSLWGGYLSAEKLAEEAIKHHLKE